LAAIVEALAPGGMVIYETFVQGNERFGRPRNPDFLLRPGELLTAIAALTIVAFEEGEVATPRPAMIQRIAAFADRANTETGSGLHRERSCIAGAIRASIPGASRRGGAPMVKSIPDGYCSVIPYLIVADGAGAIEFYQRVFGAVERMRLGGPDGKLGHAELMIGDSMIMLADENPAVGARAPGAFGGTPVSLHLYNEDVDAVAARALAAGAKLRRPVENQFYGDRLGTIEDPFGHVWHISTHVEDVSQEEIGRRAAAATKAAGA